MNQQKIDLLKELKYHHQLPESQENNLIFGRRTKLSKEKSQSNPKIKITGSPSSKNPGGGIKGSVDGRKASPPPTKK